LDIGISSIGIGTLDINYLGICYTSAKIHVYQHIRPKYQFWAKNISQNDNIDIGMRVRYVDAKIYRYQQKYRLGEYIGWIHIGPTLDQTPP
jgi:hypothetical protein